MAQQLQVGMLEPPRTRAARKTVRLALEDHGQAAGGSHVVIHDISETGLLVLADPPLSIGDTLSIRFGSKQVRAAQVVRRDENFAGCRFASPVPRAWISAALLRAPIAPTAPHASTESSHLDSAPVVAALSDRRALGSIAGLACAAWLVIAGIAVPIARSLPL